MPPAALSRPSASSSPTRKARQRAAPGPLRSTTESTLRTGAPTAAGTPTVSATGEAAARPSTRRYAYQLPARGSTTRADQAPPGARRSAASSGRAAHAHASRALTERADDGASTDTTLSPGLAGARVVAALPLRNRAVPIAGPGRRSPRGAGGGWPRP